MVVLYQKSYFLIFDNKRRVSFPEDYCPLRRRCLFCGTVSLSPAGQAYPSHSHLPENEKTEVRTAIGKSNCSARKDGPALWEPTVPNNLPTRRGRGCFPSDTPLVHFIGYLPIPSSAAGPGFEPRYSPPEGEVLPLDDPAKI